MGASSGYANCESVDRSIVYIPEFKSPRMQWRNVACFRTDSAPIFDAPPPT